VWDPHDPGRELARFDGHTGPVWRVAVLGWPGLDHPAVVTCSFDGTARVTSTPAGVTARSACVISPMSPYLSDCMPDERVAIHPPRVE